MLGANAVGELVKIIMTKIAKSLITPLIFFFPEITNLNIPVILSRITKITYTITMYKLYLLQLYLSI